MTERFLGSTCAAATDFSEAAPILTLIPDAFAKAADARAAIVPLLDDRQLAEEMVGRNARLIEAYAPNRVIGTYDSALRALLPTRSPIDEAPMGNVPKAGRRA